VRPISQTIEVTRDLDRYLGDDGLLPHLQAVGDEVQELVPDCIGLSLAWRTHGVTFTLVASDEEIAELDAVQYLDGGPCVTAVDRETGLGTTPQDAVSEDLWGLFARASAARGVRSTLTMPLTEEGRVVGSVNLYGASEWSFDAHHEELATILGAWAPGAVRNSDLSFSTLRVAEAAPDELRAERAVATASGVLAAQLGLDVALAQERLESAAARAGLTPARLALGLLHLRDADRH
jgi:GAF domain-containing protein